MKGAGGYGKIHDYKLSLSPPNVFISPPLLYHICVHWLRNITRLFCKFYKIETIMASHKARVREGFFWFSLILCREGVIAVSVQ
jgi:hypothetical protein